MAVGLLLSWFVIKACRIEKGKNKTVKIVPVDFFRKNTIPATT
jgi:hypothetical protein